MSLFGTINTALTALQATQEALAITGHNIANAGTAGYTRQAPDLRALPLTAPDASADGSKPVAGGVVVAGVLRLRNAFADAEYRADAARQGSDQVLSEAMDQVQGLLGEPSGQGLQAAMDRFFQSWSDLANNPENPAIRATVREAAGALAGSVQRLWQGLDDSARAADAKLVARASALNTAAAQIADSNRIIAQMQSVGASAADVMDQRDLLLDQIARLTGAQVVPQADGSVNVTLGGRLLVGPQGAEPISIVAGAGGYTVLHWPDGSPVPVGGGAIAGLQQVRAELVPGLQTAVSNLTGALVGAVNSTHAAGYGLGGSTGVDFFDPASTPSTFQVGAAIAADLNQIAASGSGAPGDGSNAQALTRLAQQPLLGGSSVTAFWQGTAGTLGVQAQQVQRDLDADGMLLRQAEALRQSAGGVSLDEEAASMVRYQRSYQAAAKLVAVVDEMLQTLLAI